MKKITHFIKGIIISPPAMAAIISAFFLIIVLMVHPIIGMADNGEFFGIINGQGLYKLDRYENDSYFNYFSSEYGIYQYYNEWEDSLVSSQSLYIKTALFLNHLMGVDNSIFDIRFLSIILIIELVMGVYLMVDYMAWKKSRIQGMVLGAVCIVMFVDTAYTAYFNSFYIEGIVYVSCLIITACALLLTQKRYSPIPLCLTIIINGCILIFSNQQNAVWFLPLFLLYIFIAFFFPVKRAVFRNIALGGAILMAVSGITMYVIIPEDFIGINQYHAMTRGAMMVGDNPEKTMEEFGIDKQYSILDGSTYYEKYPPIEVEGEELIENFYGKYNFVSLSVHYLTHPSEFISMLDKAAKRGNIIRPAEQGNYERRAGKEPQEKTNFFTLYSFLKEKYMPNTVGFAAIWMLLVCAMCFKNKPKLLVILCVIMMGIIPIGTSIVRAGDTDLAKHLFMYNVSFDIVSYICFGPMAAALLLNVIKGILKLVPKKKLTMFFILILFGSLNCFAIKAEASENNKSMAVIISRQGEDMSVVEKLAKARGLNVTVLTDQTYKKNSLVMADYVITTTSMPMKDLHTAKKQTIYLGSLFTNIPDTTTAVYQNKTVQFSYNEFMGNGTFLNQFSVITSTTGKKLGKIVIEGEKKIPFAVLASDGNYYVPCFDKNNTGSILLLGAVINKMSGQTNEGKTYFILDEIYAFSDLNKLCKWADILHRNGIPFLARIMPIYDNLEYPAFQRFAVALRYMQSKGGMIIIHEPIIADYQWGGEPLTDKMERFKQALNSENIDYSEFSNVPYLLSMEELLEIYSENKNFGNLPFDTMVGVTPVFSEEEFSFYIDKINKKWISFTNLQKEYDKNFYYEKNITEDYIYRTKEEAAFQNFFDVSDRFLLIVVGVSLLVLAGFLVIGRRWYKRKFYH